MDIIFEDCGFRFFPFRAFQVSDEKKLTSLKKKAAKKEEDEPEKEKAIRCGQCGSRITTAGDRMDMNGQHRHVFNNPAGYIFEIGCFGRAEGCASRGTPTMEFTWFAGFAWRFAMCGKCNAHLGWHYISSGGSSFYGLILDHLIEEE
ncbi:hypothetical protein DENIS_0935 [Desulfonema ishimotonii]|uniref:CULT domain-containing protein n=1 Tax=Desulfonema ishimotonii TaxID=45657 RepID=A0A401FSR5_9BACT|nr:cereblon family protein [Desulfonema ishimotonii]GBC59993.1 hypothetical protein DENIS_0935 [Desulfonema ishimotonii]